MDKELAAKIEKEKTCVIYNKGKRKFIIPSAFDENGKPVVNDRGKPYDQEILPEKKAKVSKAQLAHLKAQFPHEIVDLSNAEDVQRSVVKADAPAAPPTGYMSPEEVEEHTRKAVEAALAEAGKDDKEDGDDEKVLGTEERQELINKLNGMDRAELIDVIEQNNLEINHQKYKNQDALKKAILDALTGGEKAA